MKKVFSRLDLCSSPAKCAILLFLSLLFLNPAHAGDGEERGFQSPTITIEGKVTDKAGEPLISVTIRVKDSQTGVLSGLDGSYSLNGVPSNGTLIVSYVGMRPQEIEVNGRTSIDICLEEDETQLSEVVVTGYQEVKKERMTGSVSSISSKDIKNLNIPSMDQALVGTIPGLSAVVSGRPGEDARINIRGINSLTGSTDPIWIIDGMPLQGETPNLGAGGNISEMLMMSGIGNISPDDIESITVLKDAAASAIYGARAANGVIVVKTKSGREGSNQYNVTAHFGVTERPRSNVRMMTSAEKIRFEQESFIDHEYTDIGRVGGILYDVRTGAMTRDEADAEIARLEQTNTNWFDAIYSPAYSTQVNASASGGNKRTLHYTSVNFLKETGTEPNNEYMRIRLSNKLTHSLSKDIRVQTDLSGTYRTDRSSASSINPLEYALYANPYETPDGYDQSWDMTSGSLRPGLLWPTLNVLDDLNRNTSTTRYLELSIAPKVEWDTPINGLRVTTHAIFGLSSNNSRTIYGQDTYTNYMNNWLNFLGTELPLDASRGALNEGALYSNSYTWRNSVEYNKSFADAHMVNLFAGQEISSRVMYSQYNYSPVFDEAHRITGFPVLPEGTDLNSIDFSSLGSTGKYESKLSSFFVNGTYSYNDRYVLSGSLRYDGSDIIGNDNQFTPLWNTSGKWNIDRESFYSQNWFVNRLALRIGYGFTGSIDKNALPFVIMYLNSSNIYDDQSIPGSFSYANPNVKWQTKKDFNIGLETSLWEQRGNLTVNYYKNLTYDLLDYQQLALSSGRSNVIKNVGDVINRGWEIDLSADLIRKTNFVWNVRANVAFNHNEISNTFYKNLDDIADPTIETANNTFVEGYPVGAWFGYRYAGVDPATGHTLVYTEDGTFDLDLLSNETLELQRPQPEYLGAYHAPMVGGFSSNLTWGRWVFNVNLEYRAGNYIKSFNTFSPLESTNRYYADSNRWRVPGDVAMIPSIDVINKAYGKYIFDSSLERGDYLRCTYATIGYNLPAKWLETLRLQNVRLTFTANNLFTITPYGGLDPSLMGELGYPSSRRYNISLNVSF